MRVLVVEDYAELREMIEAYLSRRDHVVQTCANGNDAVRIAADFAPELVIMDYRLPDINGVAAGIEVRKAAPAARIVICSASEREQFEASAALAEHGFTYMDKAQFPAGLSQLLPQQSEA